MEPIAQHWIEFGQLVVAGAGLVVAGAGLAFVWKQLLDVKTTIELQNKNIQAQTLASIYREYFRACRELVKRPYLRPYLYEGKRFDDPHITDAVRAQVTAMCELMTGVLEQAAVQQNNLPDDAWSGCWAPFVRRMYENQASEFVAYYRANRDVYAVVFQNIVDPLVAQAAPRGEVQPTA